MKILLLLACVLLAACSALEVRCDRDLRPINKPAPVPVAARPHGAAAPGARP